jgi:hypothetical protein
VPAFPNLSDGHRCRLDEPKTTGPKSGLPPSLPPLSQPAARDTMMHPTFAGLRSQPELGTTSFGRSATGHSGSGDPHPETTPRPEPPPGPRPQAYRPDAEGGAGIFLRRRTLPDSVICQAESAGFGDYVDCLVNCPTQCPHALAFGDGFLCRHPQKHEIVLRTAARARPASK